MKLLKEPLTYLVAGLVLFGVVIPGFGIYFAGQAQESFEVSCQKEGGRVIVLRRDSLCVDPEGRILGDL